MARAAPKVIQHGTAKQLADFGVGYTASGASEHSRHAAHSANDIKFASHTPRKQRDTTFGGPRYRLIKDDTLANEVQTYLEGAQEMRPVAGSGKLKAFPFNPRVGDVKEIVGQLAAKYHVADGAIAPPFFRPGEIDWSFLDPRDVIACRNGLLQISERKLWISSAQYFTRSALPIDYAASARPERWLSFLDEVLGGDEDPLRSFVADDCELGPLDYVVTNDELFSTYQLHCQKIGAKMPLSRPKFLAALKTAFNGVKPVRLGNDVSDRTQAMRGIRLRNPQSSGSVPFIAFRLDPVALDLGFERWEPEAIMRDAQGRPVEYVSA